MSCKLRETQLCSTENELTSIRDGRKEKSRNEWGQGEVGDRRVNMLTRILHQVPKSMTVVYSHEIDL